MIIRLFGVVSFAHNDAIQTEYVKWDDNIILFMLGDSSN